MQMISQAECEQAILLFSVMSALGTLLLVHGPYSSVCDDLRILAVKYYMRDGKERCAPEVARDLELGKLFGTGRAEDALRALVREGVLASREGEPVPEKNFKPRIYYRLHPAEAVRLGVSVP